MATFNLKVITPEKAFLNQPVERMVFLAPDGEMELLPGHAPMISTLEVGTVRFFKDGEWKEFAASEGFLIVDKVETLVMTQTAEWPEEIDINRARRRQEEAEELLRQRRSNQEYHMARAMLTRAMVRMRVGKRGHPRNDAP